MSYITRTDLDIPEDMLIQLTDDEQAGGVNDARVDKAIADAQAEIDGYCGKRFSVPFTDLPALVARLTAMLAKYNLYGRRGLVPEDIVSLRKDAVRTLQDISKGLVSLGSEPEPAAASETGGVIGGPARTFSRDKLNGF